MSYLTFRWIHKLIIVVIFFVSIKMFAQDSPGLYTVKNVKINTVDSDFGTAFLGNNQVVFAAPKEGFTFNREEYNSQPFLDLYLGEVTDDGQLIHKQKMPGDINTKFHEGMVTFSKDKKTVYFSANGKIKKVKRRHRKNKEVKTRKTVNIQLFKASIDENGEWGNLEMLPFNSDKYSTGHPVLNRDDSKLYFVSDRPESYGKTDIFVVDINLDGTYSEPINLGPQINTPEREMFPFIGRDNVLYFSSDGYPGYGELDVYASKIFDNSVSTPLNLEEPVNSKMDDFAYIIDDTKNRGYFSSNREGGKGDDDIYSFTASPPIYIECQQEITGVVKNLNTQELIPNVTIFLFDESGKKLQTFISNENDASFNFKQSCNTTYKLKGYLEGYLISELDIQTVNDLNAAPIEIVFNMEVDPTANMDVIAEVPLSEVSDNEVESGNDNFELEKTDHKTQDISTQTLIAGGTPIVASASEVETDHIEDEKPLQKDFSSDLKSDSEASISSTSINMEESRTPKNTKSGYNINSIYFDFDKYNIRNDAEIELNKLVALLNSNGEMKIEVNSHTDIRGAEKYNSLLADKRANQTVQYLIEKGIDPIRVSGIGFGERQVAEKCTKESPCTALQHQLNRRSEFLIRKEGSDAIVIRSKNHKPVLKNDNSKYTAHSGQYTNYNFYESEKVYTVQVGAFKGQVKTDKYSALEDLFNHRYDDGLNRYYSGIFKTATEAKNHLKNLRENGFSDAFVIGLSGENRI